MAEVYNWQLGRKMYYPSGAGYPGEQFAFVFNINRCIACQTCTMACKSTWTFSKGQEYMWWNNVETKPYGGYPQNWDIKILKMLDEAHHSTKVSPSWDWSQRNGPDKPYGVYNGLTIFEAPRMVKQVEEGKPPEESLPGPGQVLGYRPSDEEWRFPNIHEDTATGLTGAAGEMMWQEGAQLPVHRAWFFYLQRLCNHCSYPACLTACSRKAIYKRPEDGIVLIDQSRCRGYRLCVEACPYKKPMFRVNTKVSEKCFACYLRIEGKDPLGDGLPWETRCMSACVGKIRLQGLVRLNEDGGWAEDPRNPLYFLVKVEKVALPLYPQFGTQPNGYYIPPRWAPRGYLHQMFGPGVDEAIDRFTTPSRDLLAVLQLFRTTQSIIFRYERIPGPKVYETTINGKPWEMFNDTVVGYAKDGREVTRLSVEEPFYVRPDKHSNSI